MLTSWLYKEPNGGGLVAQGTEQVPGNRPTFSSTLLTSREGRGLEAESVTSGPQVHQSCLCNEAVVKDLRGVQRALRLMNAWRSWEGAVAREGMEAPHPFSHTLSSASLPSCYF